MAQSLVWPVSEFAKDQTFGLFIGPRCPWGPIYGSGPMSVTPRGFVDLTDVTLAG